MGIRYMGTASCVVTKQIFVPFWKPKPLILQYKSLIFPHEARYAPSLFAPHPPRGPRPSCRQSSSPWVVVYLSISVTGNCDGSLSKAPRSSYFSPQTPTLLPTTNTVLLGSDGLRRGDTVLVSSRLIVCSKINGDRGDNEDRNRRVIVSEEPFIVVVLAMKSSSIESTSVFFSSR